MCLLVFFSSSLCVVNMSYGAIGGAGGSRNPFGGPTRQGYQPVGKKTSFCPLSVTVSCSQGPAAAAPLLVHGVLIHRNLVQLCLAGSTPPAEVEVWTSVDSCEQMWTSVDERVPM